MLTILHGTETGFAQQPTTSTAPLASSAGIAPAIDIPAPHRSGPTDGPVGGQASRIEFDNTELNSSMSVWYRLAYVSGGTRLRVYDHYPTTTRHPDPIMIRSEGIAWWFANEVLGTRHNAYGEDHLPTWARVHTGIDTGPSAGLIFALAYLDALTPSPLVGNLRVAGTGMVGLDGVVGPVTEIDVKVAAAMLTRPDVIFTPKPPKSVAGITVIESQQTRHPTSGYTTSQWLNLAAFERAGRVAATHSGTTAIVVVNDLRQTLAWLCGRTNNPTTCQLADTAADLPIGRY